MDESKLDIDNFLYPTVKAYLSPEKFNEFHAITEEIDKLNRAFGFDEANVLLDRLFDIAPTLMFEHYRELYENIKSPALERWLHPNSGAAVRKRSLRSPH